MSAAKIAKGTAHAVVGVASLTAGLTFIPPPLNLFAIWTSMFYVGFNCCEALDEITGYTSANEEREGGR